MPGSNVVPIVLSGCCLLSWSLLTIDDSIPCSGAMLSFCSGLLLLYTTLVLCTLVVLVCCDRLTFSSNYHILTVKDLSVCSDPCIGRGGGRKIE